MNPESALPLVVHMEVLGVRSRYCQPHMMALHQDSHYKLLGLLLLLETAASTSHPAKHSAA